MTSNKFTTKKQVTSASKRAKCIHPEPDPIPEGLQLFTVRLVRHEVVAARSIEEAWAEAKEEHCVDYGIGPHTVDHVEPLREVPPNYDGANPTNGPGKGDYFDTCYSVAELIDAGCAPAFLLAKNTKPIESTTKPLSDLRLYVARWASETVVAARSQDEAMELAHGTNGSDQPNLPHFVRIEPMSEIPDHSWDRETPPEMPSEYKRRDGRYEWTLGELIDVGCAPELGKPEVPTPLDFDAIFAQMTAVKDGKAVYDDVAVLRFAHGLVAYLACNLQEEPCVDYAIERTRDVLGHALAVETGGAKPVDLIEHAINSAAGELAYATRILKESGADTIDGAIDAMDRATEQVELSYQVQKRWRVATEYAEQNREVVEPHFPRARTGELQIFTVTGSFSHPVIAKTRKDAIELVQQLSCIDPMALDDKRWNYKFQASAMTRYPAGFNDGEYVSPFEADEAEIQSRCPQYARAVAAEGLGDCAMPLLGELIEQGFAPALRVPRRYGEYLEGVVAQ